MSSTLDEYVQKWIILANRDLRSAENEFRMYGKYFISEAVCFHAQQAAEKYLKAFLITHHIDFEKTHNIEYLVDLCAKEDPTFNSLTTGNLTFYAVESRYPENFSKPSRDNARNSIEIAKNVKKIVFSKLGVKKIDSFKD